MRVIAHISDFHFGKTNRRTETALLKDLRDLKPDLTVISGDLTRRALLRQFKRAREFIDRLPRPKLIVPGNHDVPVSLSHRLLAPLARYRYYINRQVSPIHKTPDFCVLGLNTTRSVAIEAGGFSRRQLKRAEKILSSFPKKALKIVVQHHPFIRPPGISRYRFPIIGAETALQTFERCGVDLILAGHFHRPHITDVKAWYPVAKRTMVHAQVGAALSKYLRHDLVGYNVLTLQKNRISITVRSWNGRSFRERRAMIFVKSPQGWKILNP
jgi:3',5'-cyclic AMP phosphodiesterase CpdA